MLSSVKKLSLTSALVALCATGSAMQAISKSLEPNVRKVPSTLEKNRNLANFCTCIERLLCERFKDIEQEVEKHICDENSLIKAGIESLNLTLREFFSSQLDISDSSLKDFILCRLDKLEENIEGFFCHKADCLRNVFCTQLQFINCELRNLIVLTEDIDAVVDCFAANLLGYLQAANTVGNEGNNPLVGTLDAVIASTQLCIDNSSDTCNLLTCLNTGSDTQPIICSQN